MPGPSQDSSGTSSGIPPQEFLIAPRTQNQSFDEAVNTVKSVLHSISSGDVVRINRDTNVIVIRIPEASAEILRNSLKDNFIVEQNSPLKF